MTSTLQKTVRSLFKRDFPWKIVNSIHIRDNARLFHRVVAQFPRSRKNIVLSECFGSTYTNVQALRYAPLSTFTSKDESRELMAIWPDIVRDLTDVGRNHDLLDVSKRMTKALQYTIPTGKKARALAHVLAYKTLAPEDQLTDENLRLARILGWCIEMLQSFFIIIDDIQDQSLTRRNQPCWYLYNNNGLAAINDAVLIKMYIYELLRIHFKTKECYTNMQNLFLDSTLKTIMGQSLDMLAMNGGNKPNLDLYTMDRYNAIVKYKTAYYTFVLPVTAAMYFAGVKDPEMYRQAKTILLEMGHMFQVQDDYLDCYGDASLTGKQGTDIAQGKCSWLVVVALQRVTPKQRKVLDECYGEPNEEKVNRVVQLYNELGLPNTYSIYEEETYNLLNTHIQQISRGLPHNLFLKLLSMTYGRKK
ncbi:farnesyl pyrophosphate synthase-like isoform X2 [Lasioglossum baleicum]|uniref:farnesyl pyrophosphate synthase-like isoform X2 n=1 Tax=Lasioglossum baleicum TaxID=434251 RepID=UPI003FCDC643